MNLLEFDKFRQYFGTVQKYCLKIYAIMRQCLLFLLAAVLITPVMLDRMVQVVAERVQQPEVVE